ncbi:heme A synthase [Robertmurraya andreesenii]|uniref:Heme A synthase n=1 Tax=Anoxybacillus andreesenii TaxID=1325932 RepID=A0ABT9V0G4_9BACL|nr:heme A synthase [Robertmurraya andreesenii]
MNGKRLSIRSSIIMAISAILIVISLFFPWWRMEFFAPQYPEGLNIIVYPDHLEGELGQINGLNHYIGMAQFSEESFPELKYLPYLIGGLAILVLIGAIIRKRAYLYGLIGIFIIGGAVGVWDLWSALKEYGTNLDPMAPIEMEPFVPPIIGKNVIANFTTYSHLGIGTYIVIAAFILLLIPLWKDRKK